MRAVPARRSASSLSKPPVGRSPGLHGVAAPGTADSGDEDAERVAHRVREDVQGFLLVV
jgi:hypothetical protein